MVASANASGISASTFAPTIALYLSARPNSRSSSADLVEYFFARRRMVRIVEASRLIDGVYRKEMRMINGLDAPRQPVVVRGVTCPLQAADAHMLTNNG